MSTIQDNDVLLINRGGIDYNVSAKDLGTYTTGVTANSTGIINFPGIIVDGDILPSGVCDGVQNTENMWVTSNYNMINKFEDTISYTNIAKVNINNIYLKECRFSTATKKVLINHSYVASLSSTSTDGLHALTGIHGIGVIRVLNLNSNSATEGYPNFTTIDPGIQFVRRTGSNYPIYIMNAALTADSVNHILTNYVANNAHLGTSQNKVISITGGTSAGVSKLSAEALAARTALIDAGWTVTLNS